MRVIFDIDLTLFSVSGLCWCELDAYEYLLTDMEIRLNFEGCSESIVIGFGPSNDVRHGRKFSVT